MKKSSSSDRPLWRTFIALFTGELLYEWWYGSKGTVELCDRASSNESAEVVPSNEEKKDSAASEVPPAELVAAE